MYVGQIHRALEEHRHWFENGPVVIAGDFNSNACFDETRRDRNHSTMVQELRQHSLESAYHALHNEGHGEEKTATFHLLKDEKRPFHLDYIFVPKSWKARTKLTGGSYSDWKAHSDHYPLTVDISPTA